jgi:hypothetical protein
MEEYVHNKWKGEVKYKLGIILRFFGICRVDTKLKIHIKKHSTVKTSTKKYSD